MKGPTVVAILVAAAAAVIGIGLFASCVILGDKVAARRVSLRH
jgi:hypothetical protein